MQQRAFANPKLRFIWDTVVTDIVGDSKVERLQLANAVTGEESTLDVSGLFVAIGHAPNTDLFKGQLDMDAAGYLQTGEGLGRISKASSLAATCRTTPTAKRSPQQEPAVWRHSTPNGGLSLSSPPRPGARPESPPAECSAPISYGMRAPLASVMT